MSNHTRGVSCGQDLCDAIFAALQQEISGLTRQQQAKHCALSDGVYNVFAYIGHRESKPGLYIECLGDAGGLGEYQQRVWMEYALHEGAPPVPARLRERISGEWEGFGVILEPDSDEHLMRTVEALLSMSYPYAVKHTKRLHRR